MHVPDEIQPTLRFIVLCAVRGERIPLTDAVRDDSPAKINSAFAGRGISADVRCRTRTARKLKIAGTRNVLTMCVIGRSDGKRNQK